jgi:hypothetical protein
MTPALSGSIEAELVMQATAHTQAVKIREHESIRWLKKGDIARLRVLRGAAL